MFVDKLVNTKINNNKIEKKESHVLISIASHYLGKTTIYEYVNKCNNHKQTNKQTKFI